MNIEDIELMLQIIEMWLNQYHIHNNSVIEAVIKLRNKLVEVKKNNIHKVDIDKGENKQNEAAMVKEKKLGK